MNEVLIQLGHFIWKICGFFLPMYLANGFPVLGSGIPGLAKFYKFPVDGGRRFGQNLLFGEHKTWFGIFLGMCGGAVGALLVYFFKVLQTIPGVFEGRDLYWFLFYGASVGLGAMLGDLLKSFIKRRISIKDGKSWTPFDQIDFVIGGWVFSCWFLPWDSTVSVFLGALVITPPLHLLANVVAYKVGIKKVWW